MGDTEIHSTVLESVDQPALKDRTGEQSHHYVEPALGLRAAWKDEVQQRQTIEVGGGLVHKLAGELGCGIEGGRKA